MFDISDMNVCGIKRLNIKIPSSRLIHGISYWYIRESKMDTFTIKRNIQIIVSWVLYVFIQKRFRFFLWSLHIVTHDMFGDVYIFLTLVMSISHGNIDINACAFISLNANISKCNYYFLIPIKLYSNSSLQIHVISTRVRDGHASVMSEFFLNASKSIFSTTKSYPLHVIQF